LADIPQIRRKTGSYAPSADLASCIARSRRGTIRIATSSLEHVFDPAILSTVGASKRYGDAKPPKRAVYVVVFRELPTPASSWNGARTRTATAIARWWAKTIYLDGDGLLHEGWFPAARVKPAPYAEPEESY